MIEPPVIELVLQKGSNDCAVAGLAMLLGVSYATIFGACSKRAKVKEHGLSDAQMFSVARKLGMVVRQREAPPEEDEFGMLYLKRRKPQAAHTAIYLRGGHIIDPADGLVYTDVGAFLQIKNWEIAGFYWRER